MPTATKRPALRYTLQDAAQVLGVGYTHFRGLAVSQGEFTCIRDKPSRRARVYVPADEVEVFAVGGLAGLREFRAKKLEAKAGEVEDRKGRGRRQPA